MIQRRRDVVFSMIWIGWRELERARWGRIKSLTISYTESLVEYLMM